MGLNWEAIKKAREELSKSTSRFWRPEVGQNVVRILPPREGEDLFYFEYAFHWVPAAKRSITCLKRTFGEACFICEEVQRLRAAGKTEQARVMAPRVNYLVQIIDRNNPEAGVQIWSMGKQIMAQILDLILDPEWGDITDPQKGYDIVIDRKGQDLNTTYTVRPRRTPSKVDPHFLEQMVDLSQVLEVLTYEQQQELLAGEVEESEEVDEEVPKCFGMYGMFKRCKGCPYAQECKLESGEEDEKS